MRNVITAQATMSAWRDLPAFGGMTHWNVELGGANVELSGEVEFGQAVASHTMVADSLTGGGGEDDARNRCSWFAVEGEWVGRSSTRKPN